MALRAGLGRDWRTLSVDDMFAPVDHPCTTHLVDFIQMPFLMF